MIELKKSEAFTLMEILLVITIIGGLMAFFLPRIGNYLARQKVRRTRMTMVSMKSALSEYHLDMKKYPSQVEGFDALMTPPVPRGNWNGKYLPSIDKDEWGSEMEYNSPPRDRSLGEYEIVSYGPDRMPSDDDIVVGEKSGE